MNIKKKVLPVIVLSLLLCFSFIFGFNYVHQSNAKTVEENNASKEKGNDINSMDKESGTGKSSDSDYIIESKEYKFKTKSEYEKFISELKEKTNMEIIE